MKKTVSMICFVLLLSCMTRAQFRIGMTAGMKSPTLRTENIDAQLAGKNRIAGGIIFDYQFHSDFLINLKIMYEEIQTSSKVSGSPYQFLVETNFLEIPLSLQYKMGEQIAPYIFTGISLHYNLNSDIDMMINTTKIRGDFVERIKDLSYSLFCGGGLQLNFEKYIIFVEAIYSFGLSNVLIPGDYKMKWSDISSTIQFNDAASIKFNTLNILTGIKLPVRI